MFDKWETFNELLGTAAATLIGLLFVVASLTKSLERGRAERGAQLYLTPVVFHFSIVLLMSAVGLIPKMSPFAYHIIITGAAAVGLIWSIRILTGIMAEPLEEAPHWTDKWLYGVAPGLLYLALLVIGGLTLVGGAQDARWYAGVAIALLLLGIRNAWDLVTFLVQEVVAEEDKDEPVEMKP